MKISYSRMNCWLTCQYKHYLSYYMGLSSKRPGRPLFFGGDFHKLLENRFDKKELKKAVSSITKAYNDMSNLQKIDLGETYLDDLKSIFKDYRKVYKGEPEPIETEHEFIILLGNVKKKDEKDKTVEEPIYFHGLMDELFEDTIGEHKTFNAKPQTMYMTMNVQTCLMVKAAKLELDADITKVRFDYIHSQPAKEPIWLPSSNRFSEANNNKVTPYSWLRACESRGITDQSILDKSKKFEGNIQNFYFRYEVDIIPEMVESVWNDFKAVCRDIAIRGEKSKMKNIDRHCSYCNYKDICMTEFTGGDVQYVIDRNFVIKERDKWSD